MEEYYVPTPHCLRETPSAGPISGASGLKENDNEYVSGINYSKLQFMYM